MRKIIVAEHVTLDGFVAGPDGEMDWIKLDSELFDFVKTFTDAADTALYGRLTYQMMDSYWPAAGDQPGATKHDVEHSTWYNKVSKVVISKSLEDKSADKTTFIGEAIPEKISQLKKNEGDNILTFGSPSVVRLLTTHHLIDDYWLFTNPVILGKGIPLFPELDKRILLNLADVKQFSCGVVALHYQRVE